MNTEPRFHDAVEGLWAHTVADPEEGLAVLLDIDRRRRKQGRRTFAAAAAAVVLAGWWGVTNLALDHAPRPGPSHRPATRTSLSACQALYVTCLGGRTYRFDLSRPVTWTIPQGYGVNSGAGADNGMVQSYGQGRWSDSGVAVLENVGGASPSVRTESDLPTTAAELVTWLASRPFVDATVPHKTTLDGFKAWQVRVQLKPHASPLRARCTVPAAAVPCYPLTVQRLMTFRTQPGYDKSIVSGISPDMTADYTVVDLGDNTATVVLSWAPRDDTAALDHNRALIQGIQWPITP